MAWLEPGGKLKDASTTGTPSGCRIMLSSIPLQPLQIKVLAGIDFVQNVALPFAAMAESQNETGSAA